MAIRILAAVGTGFSVAALVGTLVLSAADAVSAQQTSGFGRQKGSGEQFVPGIWIDPDGCEHWVLDDGAEGYMDPHLTRDGKPVCRAQKLCNVLEADALFPTDQFALSSAGRQNLTQFFSSSKSAYFRIAGHTDSTGTDSYNIDLSQKRAAAVAAVARSVGANVASVRGYGERQPVATNDTGAGRAQNRRVEITCVQ